MISVRAHSLGRRASAHARLRFTRSAGTGVELLERSRGGEPSLGLFKRLLQNATRVAGGGTTDKMAHLPFQGDDSAKRLLPAVALGTAVMVIPGATQPKGSGDASSKEGMRQTLPIVPK
jgi:hypothetical protein